jgi:ABC-type nitrate/sulfonate/bicarbonate transport system substrate-binding protein
MSALEALAEQGINADRDGLHVMPPEMLQGAVATRDRVTDRH